MLHVILRLLQDVEAVERDMRKTAVAKRDVLEMQLELSMLEIIDLVIGTK